MATKKTAPPAPVTSPATRQPRKGLCKIEIDKTIKDKCKRAAAKRGILLYKYISSRLDAAASIDLGETPQQLGIDYE